MGSDNPFRSEQKPEQIVQFYDSIDPITKLVVETCVDQANKWLKERVGTIDIILREVAKDHQNFFRGILIWYREKE